MLPSPLRFDQDSDRHGSPSISCVIPAYNESKNLATLLPELAALLGTLTERWEIIVVDDGSCDTTPLLMSRAVQSPGYCYIQLSRNFGKEAALSAGIDAASGDVVVLLDADHQHPIAMIAEMLECWRRGIEVAYAVRADRNDESIVKRVGSALFYRIIGSQSRIQIPPNAGDFRLMDRRVVDAIKRMPERTRFMKGLYAWVGFTSEAIAYDPAERLHGASNFSLRQLIQFAIDGITAFSTWPLRTLNLMGTIIAIASFLYSGYLVSDYWVNGHEVSGWTTIVTALFFFSGINLLALGTIGLYLGRVFDEVKQRPLYLVKSHLGRMSGTTEHA